MSFEYSPTREPLFRPFINYRIASDRWNSGSEKTLKYFDRFCSEAYPDTPGITQEMVDIWCEQRETELASTCYTRTYIIAALVSYLNKRNLTDIEKPDIKKMKQRQYIPHDFTPEELKKLFDRCDALVCSAESPKRAARFLTAGVIFRLIYSSGMRTVEIRLLKRNCVNLVTGVIDIQYSKGRDQHYVVLHDSMLNIMRQYDNAISRVYPDREYFFPMDVKSPFYQEWISIAFREIWDSVNPDHARAYDLRHLYATTNINSWTDYGFEFNDKFLYLSKSMGHTRTESTKYYYSIVAPLAVTIEKHSGATFNELVPEVQHE
jgi:integrase